MANIIEGKLNAKGKKFGIVISRFNELISSQLLSGAKDCLLRHDCKEEDITVVWVPGSYEIPLTAKKMAHAKKYDAVICLGAVIRGGTPHFDYIAAEAAKGIAHAAMETGVPVVFGIITADNLEQAIDRAGAKSGNKGFDAALTVTEMVNVLKQISGGK